MLIIIIILNCYILMKLWYYCFCSVISQVQGPKEHWVKEKNSQIVFSLLGIFIVVTIVLASFLIANEIGRKKGETFIEGAKV